MKEFELARSLLHKIVIDEVPFASVLKKSFKSLNVDQRIKNDVTALVGCELRHHLIFDNLISRFIDDKLDFEKTIYLRFYLANHLYLRRFKEAELFKLAKEELPFEEVDTLVKFVDSTNEIIPEDLDKASPEFLSLRFNTPAWVIRMWQKQYGKGLVFKVLKVNYRPSVASLRVNENNVNIDEFVSKHPDFSKSPVENMLVYQGKGSAKNNDEFARRDIFYMKMATKIILDKLELDPIKRVAVFTETPNNIFLDLMSRFGKDYSLDLVINHTPTLIDTRRVSKEMGYSYLYIYEANSDGLITCLSKKVNTFICIPKSSTLDLFRSTPDYFLRVKQDQLDAIIAEEYHCLEECSKHLDDDGELVYMIPTLSRKESNALIANFLVNHPEFSLIEEHQFFPFESYDSCMYFARLKRINND